ncbi:(deoxy)nucleoside triphosphate pyrophosphohydrolase [Algoriphagus namhaensis]
MIITVACAIILKEKKILAVLRSETMTQAGLWEFPGGKVEVDESEEDCLRREIREELNLEIVPLQRLSPSEHAYEAGKTIRLIPFLAKISRGSLSLAEHEEARWLGRSEVLGLTWATADIPIAVEIEQKWDYICKTFN